MNPMKLSEFVPPLRKDDIIRFVWDGEILKIRWQVYDIVERGAICRCAPGQKLAPHTQIVSMSSLAIRVVQ